MFFKKHPFVRLLLPLVLGILMAPYIKLPFIILLTIECLLLSLTLFAYYKLQEFNTQYIFGAILFLFLFVSGGIARAKLNKEKIQKESPTMAYAKLLNVPKQNDRWITTTLQIKATHTNGIWKEERFKSIALLDEDSLFNTLLAGNHIAIKANFSEARQKDNPFDFDYTNYLKIKSINNTVFLKKKEWCLVDSQESGLKQRALNIRGRLIRLYEEAGIHGDELAVFSALTLGCKDKLNAHLREAYSGAGAIHVLAVSGLHVGIVFLIIKFFLDRLKFLLRKEKLRYALILCGLWAYAFITGLSPSVVRASVMFSFVLLGFVLGQKIKIYNSLAASAFFILLLKPMLIYDIGFQLSYIAVTGIVFFHPYIKSWISFKYSLLNKLWSLTAVSLAAQLVTFPICLYYFHQFPSYFWLSNIFVVLSAGILVYAAVFLLLFSPFHGFLVFAGKVVSLFVSGLNNFVFSINELPFSVIQGIYISKVQIVLAYFLVGSITTYFILRKSKFLFSSLLIILCFGVLNLHETLSKKNKYTVGIYQNKKFSAIQFNNRKTSYWLVNCNDSSIDINKFLVKANSYWKTKNSFVYPLVSDTVIITPNFIYKLGFFAFGNNTGKIFNASTTLPQKTNTLLSDLDYIILTGNVKVKLHEITDAISYGTIVVDGTVPIWKQKKWIKQKSIDIHYTAKQGAFICSSESFNKKH